VKLLNAFSVPRNSAQPSTSPLANKTDGVTSDDESSYHFSEHGDTDADQRPPPYGDSHFSLATKTIDATKFTKALQQVNPVTSDNLLLVRNFYDEIVTSLSSVTGIPQPLPE